MRKQMVFNYKDTKRARKFFIDNKEVNKEEWSKQLKNVRRRYKYKQNKK
jgi:hypothetical protein